MYRSVEERIRALEDTVERQAFQIRLLQSLVENYEQYKLYQQVISSGMSERCFEQLKTLTYDFERKLNAGISVTLNEYIREFERVLEKDDLHPQSSFVADLIPKWLAGTMGSKGFSRTLHEHFYA